jgi:hypothetical protein
MPGWNGTSYVPLTIDPTGDGMVWLWILLVLLLLCLFAFFMMRSKNICGGKKLGEFFDEVHDIESSRRSEEQTSPPSAKASSRKSARLPSRKRFSLMPAPPAAVIEGNAAVPKVGKFSKPVAKQRLVTQPARSGPDAEEVKSKYRWDVDVGKYFWTKTGGGGGGAFNVAWGKQGATCSTPIVVKDTVTLEQDESIGGGSSSAAPVKRKFRRPTTGGGVQMTDRSRCGSQSFFRTFSKLGGGGAKKMAPVPEAVNAESVGTARMSARDRVGSQVSAQF